jgi:hypothetical protein
MPKSHSPKPRKPAGKSRIVVHRHGVSRCREKWSRGESNPRAAARFVGETRPFRALAAQGDANSDALGEHGSVFPVGVRLRIHRSAVLAVVGPRCQDSAVTGSVFTVHSPLNQGSARGRSTRLMYVDRSDAHEDQRNRATRCARRRLCCRRQSVPVGKNGGNILCALGVLKALARMCRCDGMKLG